jgi:ribonucleotide monophosphatase NagD (HAD superfamily)
VFDADGVLWTGDEPIPGSADTIKELIRAGKRVLVMTNNSTKTADEWDVKCAKLGFDGINYNRKIKKIIKKLQINSKVPGINKRLEKSRKKQ